MKREQRTAVYDRELHIEAYRLEGIAQPFPSHFHDYYVVGLVEQGERLLSCNGENLFVKAGDILLFCPGNSHACVQSDGALDYRGVNLPQETMMALMKELTGKPELPGFSKHVVLDEEIGCCLRRLHGLVMGHSPGIEKEECLLFFLSLLLEKYGQPFEPFPGGYREEIDAACAFLEEHLAEPVSLDQICGAVGLSKSTLLRAFAKAKGMTPYNYLVNLRIGRAKHLLEHGATPMETALDTGFCDQSHFTGVFHRLLGLTPGLYREIFTKEKENGPAK